MRTTYSVNAAVGLLLGVGVQYAPGVAASSGPVVAIEKAHAAAAAESSRAHASDAQAAQIFAPTNDAPVAASDTSASVPAAAIEASKTVTTANAAPASNTVATANAAPGAPAPASADGKYDSSRHRDPFRPPPQLNPAGERAVARTPLEGYEIGQLKLVGIVKNAANARAMVEDSAGLGYIVTTGTPIGSSGGVVRAIEQRRVLIQEQTTNPYGEKQATEVVMELPQEDRSP